MSEKVNIRISRELYEAILKKLQNYIEFNSIEDLIEHILWDFIMSEEEAYDNMDDFNDVFDSIPENNGKPLKGFSYL